jgi:hypothetical protein
MDMDMYIEMDMDMSMDMDIGLTHNGQRLVWSGRHDGGLSANFR